MDYSRVMRAEPMGLAEAVALFFRKYAVFKGRSRRAEYWWVALVNFVLFLFLNKIAESGFESDPVNFNGFYLLIFVFLLLIVPLTALTVRRLHDVNLSGWFILVGLIPLVGAIFQIVLGVTPGTSGSNRFGPDPLFPEQDIAPQFGNLVAEASVTDWNPSGTSTASSESLPLPPETSYSIASPVPETPPPAPAASPAPVPPPAPPAGWYPSGPNEMRWWDGAEWTEHTYPVDPS